MESKCHRDYRQRESPCPPCGRWQLWGPRACVCGRARATAQVAFLMPTYKHVASSRDFVKHSSPTHTCDSATPQPNFRRRGAPFCVGVPAAAAVGGLPSCRGRPRMASVLFSAMQEGDASAGREVTPAPGSAPTSTRPTQLWSQRRGAARPSCDRAPTDSWRDSASSRETGASLLLARLLLF